MFGYPLALSSRKTTKEVEDELLRLLGIRDLLEASKRWPAVWKITVKDVSAMWPPTQEMWLEFLGRPATTEIGYTLDAKTDWDQYQVAETVMAASAAQLVERVDAVAAALLFEVDDVLMRRAGGRLYLVNKDFSSWKNPAILAKIPGPYEFRDDLEAGFP